VRLLEEDRLWWWTLGFSCRYPKELAEYVGSEEAAAKAGGDWTDGIKLEWEASPKCSSGKSARESVEEEWGRGRGKGSASGNHQGDLGCETGKKEK